MPQDESSSRDDRVNEAIAAYLQAVERGETPDRERFLAEYADIAAELNSFFTNHAEFRQLANLPVAGGGAPRPDVDETQANVQGDNDHGTVIAGRYKLLERIGEGGMGTVWVAHQTQPVRRKVALKLIKAGMDSRSVLSRFEAERQALAVMDHPNIAKVLDGGLTETNRPFFVMEYV